MHRTCIRLREGNKHFLAKYLQSALMFGGLFGLFSLEKFPFLLVYFIWESKEMNFMGNCSSIVKTRRRNINLYPLHSISLENQFIYNRNLVGNIIHYAWGGGAGRDRRKDNWLNMAATAEKWFFTYQSKSVVRNLFIFFFWLFHSPFKFANFRETLRFFLFVSRGKSMKK